MCLSEGKKKKKERETEKERDLGCSLSRPERGTRSTALVHGLLLFLALPRRDIFGLLKEFALTLDNKRDCEFRTDFLWGINPLRGRFIHVPSAALKSESKGVSKSEPTACAQVGRSGP